ncbi:hypothetical protein TorRG33x02_293990, partial [Trema orientale]
TEGAAVPQNKHCGACSKFSHYKTVAPRCQSVSDTAPRCSKSGTAAPQICLKFLNSHSSTRFSPFEHRSASMWHL